MTIATVLQTTFDCLGTSTTVGTTESPPETLAQLSARHDARVAAAEDNCTSSVVSLGSLTSAWDTDHDGDEWAMVYANDSSYGQSQHDADVVNLKRIYPPT